MNKQRRWMTSMIEQSAKTDAQMPWARGTNRAMRDTAKARLRARAEGTYVAPAPRAALRSA
ncbi:hypothetical protein AQS8620_00546 [Aquimixticola soesokkakensis]|uniref:Uncharacterized protein n=1 Tax=Aquimixticola soesokkakensis TaxID=1519096 RepID=A0A1Y5RMP3_9RHOB|nr:hypothetical protein [Aquimixticola soesokkakensis]SLN20693.1 hypothetical protein AQS8620_00546 [Aquimixticola soesokkakensis]